MELPEYLFKDFSDVSPVCEYDLVAKYSEPIDFQNCIGILVSGDQNTGWFFSLVRPLKVLSTEKLILARLGVSRPIYVNVDSPNLSFPYFNLLGGYQWKNTLYIYVRRSIWHWGIQYISNY